MFIELWTSQHCLEISEPDVFVSCRNFTGETPLESIETTKSRVLLKELEPQWWILASVELTKIPSSALSSTKKPTHPSKEHSSTGAASIQDVEFSAREVAPAQLLLAQLSQAHRIFLLHHGTSLSELWKKHETDRQLFCSLLQRYWSRFIWNWDVLLHGNPAAELSNAIKLAGGGELGIGVGEEEWGSGEREVLEGFAGRTEGLLDLIVGRYGDSPRAQIDSKQTNERRADQSSQNPEPWLGNGEDSQSQDGLIFSGIGGFSRRSLATLSHWMEAIYVYGESAYGIGENPAARQRHSRKRRKFDKHRSTTSRSMAVRPGERQREELHQKVKSTKTKAPDLRRKAIENSVTPPGIPPPLVSAVERSLDDAITKASVTQSTQTGGDGGQSLPEHSQRDQEQASMFGTEKMLKYLSLGYGSSWTLSPKGFGADNTPDDSSTPETEQDRDEVQSEDMSAEEQLQELDPTPDVSDEEDDPFVQRLEQSIGKFLIGLSGDLENTEFEDDSSGETPENVPKSDGSVALSSSMSTRLFLRTLTMEVSPSRSHLSSSDQGSSLPAGPSNPSQDKTSASASVDGAQQTIVTHEKVQVVVYVHQPFIFVFLFQLHTPNVSMPGFYRTIHHTLGPLQKSLLRSTDPERWRERVKAALDPGSGVPSTDESRQTKPTDPKDALEIYDLIYDPLKLTVRTSIPNIPVPGSLAAEGLHRTHHQVRPITVSGSWLTLGIPVGSRATGHSAQGPNSPTLIKSNWTRIEALNVHTHVVNVWAATRPKTAANGTARSTTRDLERTIKTARAWWVVWMRVPSPQRDHGEAGPSDQEGDFLTPDPGNHDGTGVDKEALLVRRSPQARGAAGSDVSGHRSDSRSISSTGRWLLREQPRSREASGAGPGHPAGQGNGASPGLTNAKGVSEGVGVDARKWAEGLIRLSM